jgi:hypothetical protein
MSRELREKAELVIEELKEALIPLSEEIRKLKYQQNSTRVE